MKSKYTYRKVVIYGFINIIPARECVTDVVPAVPEALWRRDHVKRHRQCTPFFDEIHPQFSSSKFPLNVTVTLKHNKRHSKSIVPKISTTYNKHIDMK